MRRPHDATTAYDVPARRGQPLGLFRAGHEPAVAERYKTRMHKRCELSHAARRVLGLLNNLTAGIARFHDCLARVDEGTLVG